MPPVPNATARRIRHASGYLGLGMAKEATAELAMIPPADSALPEVLNARIELHMAMNEWDIVIRFGRELAKGHPDVDAGWIGWAYALRELNRIEEAKAVLLEAEPLHGKTCGVLHYNLACYYCLLGALPEAKKRLSLACKMDVEWKKAALNDLDLKAMWTEIAAMK